MYSKSPAKSEATLENKGSAGLYQIEEPKVPYELNPFYKYGYSPALFYMGDSRYPHETRSYMMLLLGANLDASTEGALCEALIIGGGKGDKIKQILEEAWEKTRKEILLKIAEKVEAESHSDAPIFLSDTDTLADQILQNFNDSLRAKIASPGDRATNLSQGKQDSTLGYIPGRIRMNLTNSLSKKSAALLSEIIKQTKEKDIERSWRHYIKMVFDLTKTYKENYPVVAGSHAYNKINSLNNMAREQRITAMLNLNGNESRKTLTEEALNNFYSVILCCTV